MSATQYILCLIAILLAMVLVYQWKEVNKAEEGPKKLLIDINDHAFGGMPRADLEPWLSRRGGDVKYQPVDGNPRVSGVDHVIWHNIRHIGDAQENLEGEFYYDQGEHLTYFVTHRIWERPQKR